MKVTKAKLLTSDAPYRRLDRVQSNKIVIFVPELSEDGSCVGVPVSGNLYYFYRSRKGDFYRTYEDRVKKWECG